MQVVSVEEHRSQWDNNLAQAVFAEFVGDITLAGVMHTGGEMNFATLEIDDDFVQKLPYTVQILPFSNEDYPYYKYLTFSNDREEIINLVGTNEQKKIPCKVTISSTM